jgi:TolA-binding protein
MNPMDYSSIIVGVLALTGTLLGSIMSNNKTQALVTYRLQQLEEKVNKHNNLVERMYKMQEKQMVMDEQIKVANHRITDLEDSKP